MTDEMHDPDPGDDPSGPGALPLADEIAVGAVLDGEATDAELRRVLGEPRLVARLDELRRVRGLLGPDAAPEAAAATDAATVTALGTTARHRPAGRPAAEGRVAPGWIAAAAAVVLLVVGGAFLAGRDSGDTVATSSSDATTAPTTAPTTSPTTSPVGAPGVADREIAPRSATAEAGPAGVTTTAPAVSADASPAAGGAPGGTVDLGDVPDTAELARRAAATSGVPIAGASGSPCADVLAGRGATTVATARVDGIPVVVGDVPGGGLVVLDRTSCRPFDR